MCPIDAMDDICERFTVTTAIHVPEPQAEKLGWSLADRKFGRLKPDLFFPSFLPSESNHRPLQRWVKDQSRTRKLQSPVPLHLLHRL